jgi:hypothetical protein
VQIEKGFFPVLFGENELTPEYKDYFERRKT